MYTVFLVDSSCAPQMIHTLLCSIIIRKYTSHFFVHSYSAIPEDLHRIETLQHFDMRLNRLKYSLPDVMEELPDLARLNISGNGLSEVNTDHVKHLQQLNCSDNSLKILSIVEGPLKELAARNNSMCNQ